MKPRPIRLLLALGLAFVLVADATACSDDSDDSADASGDTTENTADESTDDTTATTDEMTDESEASAEAGTIADVAIADGRFTTLVSAVEAAGLVETLSGDGPYTVFAPTDDALAALPERTLDSLLADPEGALAPILTYHVVEGEVPAADVAELDGQEVTTVNGATSTVNVSDDGAVSLTDDQGNTVNVIIIDVPASNEAA
jgi:uncharacterized surface protein with fasciclin (FAS1) repeats